MLKKTITYEDFNGEEVTEDFYFNLSPAELVELEVSAQDGFAETLKKIIAEENGKLIIEHFKKIILLSYGQKSEDGKRFIKSQELRDAFSQTNAYSALFVELATSANAAADFINGVVPAKMAQNIGNLSQEVETIQLPSEAKEELSDEDLLKIPPKDMTREQLQRAFALKNQ